MVEEGEAFWRLKGFRIMRLRVVALALAGVLIASNVGLAQNSNVSGLTDANMIPFEFSNTIEGYNVSGIWFPNVIPDGYQDLQGPAVFIFKNVQTGSISEVAENSISLLGEAYWKDKGIVVYEYYEKVPELTAKLKQAGKIVLTFSEDDRAKLKNCYKSTDKCLIFGEAVIDFQDTDFDGQKELIVVHAHAAQRKVNAYIVHSFEKNDDGSFQIDALYDKGSMEPLNSLDDFSTVNISKKTIEIEGSGGACSSTSSIYAKKKDKYDDGFDFIHFTIWEMDDAGKCYKEEYSVERDGAVGHKMKLISRVIQTN